MSRLTKKERICRNRQIESLFDSKQNRAFNAFPVRMVCIPGEEGNQMMVSVPKRQFKHAVDRNRVKRQIREAYREHKHLLDGKSMAMAFVWQANRHLPSKDVSGRVLRLLEKAIKAGNAKDA